MLYRFRQSIVLFSCAALVWTAGEGAEAVIGFNNSVASQSARLLPRVVRPPSHPAYFTEQALVERLIFPRRVSPKISPIRLARSFLSMTTYSVIPLVTWHFRDDLTQTFFHIFAISILHKAIHLLLGDSLKLNSSELNCGVNGQDFTLTPGQTKIPLFGSALPRGFIDIGQAQLDVTVQRGMHEAGTAIRVEYKEKGQFHYKIIVVKVVSSKRAHLPLLLEAKVRQTLTLEHLKKLGIQFPLRLTRLDHTRYSTTSDPTNEDEAHPHIGESTRRATIYSSFDGERVKSQEDVHIVFTHNGDHDGIRTEEGDFIPADEEKKELALLLRNPEDPSAPHPNEKLGGDTPIAAMELAIRRTKGDAYASLRLARRNAVSRILRLSPPLPEQIQRWQVVFETVVDRLPEDRVLDNLRAEEITALKQQMTRAFERAAGKDATFWKGLSETMIRPICDSAIDAFLYNDLFHAAQSFARDASTSYGVGIMSSVDEDPVFYAKGQGFSLARDREKKRRGWNSEARALAVEDSDGSFAYQERLDLNDDDGEVARFSEEGTATIYSVKENRLLRPEEAENQWFDLNKSPYTSPMRRKKDDKPGTRSDLEKAAYYQEEVDRIWRNPQSPNRIVAQNITNVVLKLADDEQQGKLGGDTHFLFTGMHTDVMHGTLFADILNEDLPRLNTRVVDGNQILLHPTHARRKYRITENTSVFILDYFGEKFAAGQSLPAWFKQYVHYIFGITGGEDGDLDSNLARKLGQNMKAGSPLASNVITVGSPWPESQAESIAVTNYYSTVNYLELHVLLALRRKYPKGEPLGLKLTEKEIKALLSMQPRVKDMVAGITGMDAEGKVVTSETREESKRVERLLTRQFSEPRRMRYLKTYGVLAGTLLVGAFFGVSPQSLVSHYLAPGRFSNLMIFLVNFAYFTLLPMVLIGLFRYFEKRQLFSRQGPPIVGVAAWDISLFLEDYMNKLWGVSRTDATIVPEGADTIGTPGSNFLEKIKPKLSRNSWVINMQTDDRFAWDSSQNTLTAAAKMVGTQSKVDKSLPFMPLVLFLNRWLKHLGMRIPFAGPRVITIGYHWPSNPNAEDYRIPLPTVIFPLPDPVSQFLRAFTRQAGYIFSIDHRIALWEVIKSAQNQPEEAYSSGARIAEYLGMPAELTPLFSEAVSKADGTLFRFTLEDLESHERLYHWIIKRIQPIGTFLGGAVLNEAAARNTNSPAILKHRGAPVGRTHSAALISTTATGVSAMLLMRDMGKPSILKDLSAVFESQVENPVLRIPEPISLRALADRAFQNFPKARPSKSHVHRGLSQLGRSA